MSSNLFQCMYYGTVQGRGAEEAREEKQKQKQSTFVTFVSLKLTRPVMTNALLFALACHLRFLRRPGQLQKVSLECHRRGGEAVVL